jgi:hypothetical protein
MCHTWVKFPGGLPIGLPPPYDLIHLFLPGPPTVTLPFTGLQLQGLDVEPTTITDFKGETAMAFLSGCGAAGRPADVSSFRPRDFIGLEGQSSSPRTGRSSAARSR